MSKVYAVNYDLRSKQRPEYVCLEEELKNSPAWWHNLESTWLISTEESPSELWARIRPHINDNDSVLIIEVRDNVAGLLPKDAWGWIHDQVPSPDTVSV